MTSPAPSLNPPRTHQSPSAEYWAARVRRARRVARQTTRPSPPAAGGGAAGRAAPGGDITVGARHTRREVRVRCGPGRRAAGFVRRPADAARRLSGRMRRPAASLPAARTKIEQTDETQLTRTNRIRHIGDSSPLIGSDRRLITAGLSTRVPYWADSRWRCDRLVPALAAARRWRAV